MCYNLCHDTSKLVIFLFWKYANGQCFFPSIHLDFQKELFIWLVEKQITPLFDWLEQRFFLKHSSNLGQREQHSRTSAKVAPYFVFLSKWKGIRCKPAKIFYTWANPSKKVWQPRLTNKQQTYHWIGELLGSTNHQWTLSAFYFRMKDYSDSKNLVEPLHPNILVSLKRKK